MLIGYEKIKILQSIVSIIITIIIFLTILYFQKEILITVGDISLIVMMYFIILNYSWQMSFHISLFMKEANRLTNAIVFFSSTENKEKCFESHKITTGETLFDNVSFRHSDTNQFVLSNLTLLIKSKDKIAIIGESGSGKTSSIKI